MHTLQRNCHVISSCLCPAPVCIVEQKDTAEPFDVEEVVQEMPRDQRETLWGRLVSLLQDILLELPAERWEENMEVESAADLVSLFVTLCTLGIFCIGLCLFVHMFSALSHSFNVLCDFYAICFKDPTN